MAFLPRASHVTVICQLAFIVACIVASCVEGVDSSSVVDVFRMVQYDLGGKPLGSRKAGLNQHISSGLAVPGGDIARAVIVMPVESINETLLNGKHHARESGCMNLGWSCVKLADQGISFLSDGKLAMVGALSMVMMHSMASPTICN
jgi:hypothetical protein